MITNFPNVAIIILNWNGWKDTIECLESVYNMDYPNFTVIVVDNCSNDNSIKKIKDYAKGHIKVKSNFFTYNPNNKPINLVKYDKNSFDNINLTLKSLVLINNNANYGFAEGNNIAIKFALKSLQPDYILLLNNDTVVEKKLLKEMVDLSSSDKKIAITQAKLLYYSNPKTINTTGNMLDRFGGFKSRGWNEIDNFQYDDLIEKGYFYASGGCSLINVKFILEINPDEFFDNTFFAYNEDIDISWMARLLEFRIIYCPEAVCYHKEGKSIKKSPSLLSTYLSYKNNIRTLIKNLSLRNLIWILPIAIIIDGIISVLAMFYNKRPEHFKVFIKAFLWNISRLNDSIKKRNIIQSKRKLNDKEIFISMEKGSIKISSIISIVKNIVKK